MTHGPPRQFVKHMLQTLRYLVRGDQAPPIHFLTTRVLRVMRIVEDLHEDATNGYRISCT